MANKFKKKRETTNKTKDWLTDYYKTGREWDKENRRRQEESGQEPSRGLKNLTPFEQGCIALIALGIIGFIVKIFVLGHGFMTIGI